LTCDTLKYNTNTKLSTFLGPTYIRSNENFIYCEKGWYNTDSEKSLFTDKSFIKTKGQTLRGDTIKYDRSTGVGICINNVSVIDSMNKITITGDYGEHHELEDSSFVTGHATMVQAYPKDSLFMHGDTLKAVTNPALRNTADSTKRNMFAYHHVKMFKNDLQGKCDSLAYFYQDSTINMYGHPLLWSGLNQLSADSISIQTANSTIDKMYLVNSAFITSRADSLESGPIDSLRFNQIRGKNMIGYFEDNKLNKISVKGNGQTIYYTKNKKQKLFGVNRADCSDLLIHVNENKVQQISLLNQPDGTLYPIKEVTLNELRLKGFFWADESRPKSKDDIYETPLR
jgi:lipopolysaccharide export system protein LptA